MVKNQTDYLKALADDTRLKIIKYLLFGKKNVTQITYKVKKSQPNISLSLKRLMFSNIIIQKKDGRKIYYSLKEPEKIKNILNIIK